MAITGYIIEKYNNMSNAYTCNRLVDEAKRAGIDLRIIGIYDTCLVEGAVLNAGQAIDPRDFAINRYKWGREKDAVSYLCRRSYNEIDAFNIFINKYEQIRRLKSDAFIIPKYMLGTNMLDFSQIADYLSLPFIAKGLECSMGEEIIKVDNIDDYELLRSKYPPSKEWLYEEFITSSYGRDIRFYSIRGEVVACMQRRSHGDFRANVALGASVEPYSIDSNIRQIARDIYAQTRLDFLGIDLMFGEGLPYFCEINVMPGIEGIERASGVNVAGRIIDTIRKDFDNE